ncbi:MAG TPA: pyridoxal phosphate-dependent aminotransferase [Gemmataceae bacterium]|nr:pyridoxal phosphate-dependent aminotransferase [Gemmataceae bacterium]
MRLPLLLLKLFIHTGLARALPGVQRRLGGGADFLRYYSNRLLTSPLWELDRVAANLESQGPEVIDLTQGFPCFDLLPSASTKLPADRRGWPPFMGLAELRSAVAEKLLADNGLAFNPAGEVLITAGVLGAVQTVLDAFVNRGDRVVLFDPCSPLYSLLAGTRQARIHWLPTWMENGRTRFRLDHLARALHGARLLVLNSPANPTGGVIAAEDLEQIAWWADRNDVLILSDGAFERYQQEGSPISIGTMPRARQRTLTAGSVSQGYALASARVGWLAAYRHLLRPCLLTAALRSPLVPTISQQIALTALRTDPGEFESIRAAFESRRRYGFERLRAMELNPCWPAGGFFLWVPVWERGVSGRCFAEALLRERKVRVSPGELFGPSGAGYIRISYATEDGRLQEGLNRLADFLQGSQGQLEQPARPLAA